jgi:hypothetical protein
MSCSCSKPCGCGGGGPGTAGEVAGPFSQPQFFPGQLLTEDDLQAVVRYTVGKNRLTNRFTYGTGVVCGLVVHCADKGSVAVTPGYALDCCGNDIVVECPEVIDINALVRQLPRDGSCVDPCENENGARTYNLVIEHTETPTDPTAPYQTADCWTATGCEFSRLQEGYRFALRCEAPPCDRDDLLGRGKACVEASAQRLEALRNYGQAARAVVTEGTREFGDLRIETERLADEIESADAQRIRDTDVARLATHLARIEQAGAGSAELDGLKTALSDLLEVRERAGAEASIAQRIARRIVGQVEPGAQTFDNASRGIKLALDATELRELSDVLHEHRDWLLCEVAKVDLATDCTLRGHLEQTSVSSDDPEILEAAFERLYEAYQRLIHQCLCLAVLVPCPPCDDLAVYLASIKVAECEVVEVCNLVRRQLLSGPLLRHWLPIGWLEQAVRSWCCSWHPTPLGVDIEAEPEPVERPEEPEIDEGPIGLVEAGDVLLRRLVDPGRRLGLSTMMRDVFARSRQPWGLAPATGAAPVTPAEEAPAEEVVTAKRAATAKEAATGKAATKRGPAKKAPPKEAGRGGRGRG